MLHNEQNISGDINNDGSISGSLGVLLSSISGGINPNAIDYSKIHYDTKANWETGIDSSFSLRIEDIFIFIRMQKLPILMGRESSILE